MIVVLTALSSSVLFAQNNTNEGWGRKSQYNRMYDVTTFTQIAGVILKVEQIVPMNRMSSGIHLLVKTASETISVHLGPQWYIDKQSIKFQAGDKVEVKGSRVVVQETPAIIAREIIKGSSVLILRDENGIPAWSGRGRR